MHTLKCLKMFLRNRNMYKLLDGPNNSFRNEMKNFPENSHLKVSSSNHGNQQKNLPDGFNSMPYKLKKKKNLPDDFNSM